MTFNIKAYGYNRYTKAESYRSPYYIISSLVDIVSKNGNYLLNIGPDGDGVVPPPVVERLAAVGSWLKQAGDCIYGTVSGLAPLVRPYPGLTCCSTLGLLLLWSRVWRAQVHEDTNDFLYHCP